jgi:DNA-directed RNA polymerase specialized sigma24 family protein
MSPDPSTSESVPSSLPGVFPVTQWSMVINAGEGSESRAGLALETLCRQYWYPLYTFLRRQGKTHHDAEDCTQEFLARMLSQNGVAKAKPERGRFRTFLLTSLRNFMTNEWQRGQAAKRGGGQVHLPLEFETAGERFAREPIDPGLTPEQVFDRNYAIDAINRSIEALRADYEKSGRTDIFTALRPFLWGDGSPGSLALRAEGLGMNAHALSVALQRLRRRLGECLREEVGQTVATEADLDAELRHLITASAGASPRA